MEIVCAASRKSFKREWTCTSFLYCIHNNGRNSGSQLHCVSGNEKLQDKTRRLEGHFTPGSLVFLLVISRLLFDPFCGVSVSQKQRKFSLKGILWKRSEYESQRRAPELIMTENLRFWGCGLLKGLDLIFCSRESKCNVWNWNIAI